MAARSGMRITVEVLAYRLPSTAGNEFNRIPIKRDVNGIRMINSANKTELSCFFAEAF
jgi:hypothetical protein